MSLAEPFFTFHLGTSGDCAVNMTPDMLLPHYPYPLLNQSVELATQQYPSNTFPPCYSHNTSSTLDSVVNRELWSLDVPQLMSYEMITNPFPDLQPLSR